MTVYTDSISETELMESLATELRLRKWKIAHFRPAQDRAGRWSTPVQYDAEGFPDLIATHPIGGVLACEVKSATGTLSTAQVDWLEGFKAAGASTFVVHPDTIGDVSESIRALTAGP